MNYDISDILSEWPYTDESGLQVRRIAGRDGSFKLQLRIDLGVLQMELSGRPDGQRPFGAESLLEYHRNRVEDYRREHGWYEGFELDAEQCAALRQESLQYYHRRIALMSLQEYLSAAADADRNLQLLDFLKAFAGDRDDWLASEQYRPFILSHQIQCLTLQHLAQEDVRAAMLEVDRGSRLLREVFVQQERTDEFEESAELAMLEDLKRKLEARYQVSHRQKLQILLDDALRREEPDLVATLRAQLRELETED